MPGKAERATGCRAVCGVWKSAAAGVEWAEHGRRHWA